MYFLECGVLPPPPPLAFSCNISLNLPLHSGQFGVCSAGVVCFFASESIQGEKPRRFNCAGVLEKHSNEVFPPKTYRLEELIRWEVFGSGDYLSSTELLNNGCYRVFIIEICIGKLVKTLLAILICYQMQTFPPWVPQLEKRKHVKLFGEGI